MHPSVATFVLRLGDDARILKIRSASHVDGQDWQPDDGWRSLTWRTLYRDLSSELAGHPNRIELNNVEFDRALRERDTSVGARQRQQVGNEASEAVSLTLHLGQRLVTVSRRHLRMAAEQFEVALDGGERRTQLVRGVGDEALLGPIGRLDAREHRVERCGEPPEFIVMLRRGYPVRE